MKFKFSYFLVSILMAGSCFFAPLPCFALYDPPSDGRTEVRLDLRSSPAWVVATDVWTDPAQLVISFREEKESEMRIDVFEQEGNAVPEMASVFNEYLKKQRYLFLVVKWHYSLPSVDTEGAVYEVHAYKIVASRKKLAFLEDNNMSKIFGSGFDGQQEGKAIKFKYKNATEIRNQLNRLSLLR